MLHASSHASSSVRLITIHAVSTAKARYCLLAILLHAPRVVAEILAWPSLKLGPKKLTEFQFGPGLGRFEAWSRKVDRVSIWAGI